MRIKKVISLFVLTTVVFFCCACNKQSKNFEYSLKVPQISENYTNFMRGAWVTTAWGIDFPKKPTTKSSQLKKELDVIVHDAVVNNLNSLFFQVRPSADALYKSKIFPWSKFLTGEQGTAPDNEFDPLEYIIQECHKANIKLHAWINPYRITTQSTDVLHGANPAKIFPELTIKVNEKLYFNPAIPRAREIVLQGICEIVQNYNIDGIHFDDYFYPEEITTEDIDEFINYGNEFNTIADWRRHNVDELIRLTNETVKSIKPNIVFGVSPSGIWANKSATNPLGSETQGFESLNAIYADSHKWVKKGYIDYIAPQLYWYIGQQGSDFIKLLPWWEEVCRNTEVSLYIGIAGYKVGSGGAWNMASEFENQIMLSKEHANGVIVFSFGDVRELN